MNDNTNNIDNSMPLAIADELCRMETNLAQMQADVRGHKQLCRCVERMKATLLAHGYEMTSMLGQPYVDGMRVVAHFVIDDQMPPEAPPRITNVSKPQVNYQGRMIQVAQVTVSQPL